MRADVSADLASVKPLSLTLYVAGNTAASRSALVNLESILHELQADVSRHVVDVLSDPEEALRQRVFVTPSLVIRRAQQQQMIIGDLSHRDRVLAVLRALLNP